jgi:predicted nucleotidyltransferase
VDPARLRAAAAEVARSADLRLVVLFGSAARGEAGAEDLDIGVLGPPGAAVDPVAITNHLVQRLAVQEVDVTDLARADPVLLALVARDGVPLYESSAGEFAQFASLAVRRFADTRKFRVGGREAIRDYLAREARRR